MGNKIFLLQTEKGKGLFAGEEILAGEKILEFEKNFVDYPTNKTLRIGENTHQLSTDPEAFENFINHSCEPTAQIDFKNLFLIASRTIDKGEEITYDYFTSDWEDEDVFDCRCGSSNCRLLVNGFKNLTQEERLKIKDKLSPFLLSKLELN